MAVVIIESLIAGLISASSKWLQDAIGPDTPACTFDSEADGDQWWTRVYQTQDDGSNTTIAEICWTAGGYTITQDDSDVVNCLMGLHMNQASTCIDTGGSSCDTHPGTAIGNVRNIYSLDGSSNDQQIDQFSADRIATAFSHMVNHDKGWNIGSYMDIEAMNDDGTYTSWAAQIRGTGDEDC